MKRYISYLYIETNINNKILIFIYAFITLYIYHSISAYQMHSNLISISNSDNLIYLKIVNIYSDTVQKHQYRKRVNSTYKFA